MPANAAAVKDRLLLPGFTPAKPKDTGGETNPGSSFAHASAIRAVLLYTLVDVFELRPEEASWAGYVLDDVCGELLTETPHSVPFAARQEMLNGTYSRLLELRGNAHIVRGPAGANPHVAHASRTEWVEVLLSPIVSSYTLPPMVENEMRAHLSGLLADLGVGDSESPRQATHLPSELRQRIATRR